MFSAVLTGIAYSLRFVADLFDKENSAQMVAAVKAKRLQALKDAVSADVTIGNVDKVRNDLAQ